MQMNEEYEETPLQKHVRTEAERKESGAVFKAEHQAHAAAGVFGPFGSQAELGVGPGPVASNESPGADTGDGLTA
jgi:hypothetical protein